MKRLMLIPFLAFAVAATSCSKDECPPLPEVTFESLTANGSDTETTTALTLTFSRAIDGLSAGDITIDSDIAVKGELTDEGGGVYTLAVTVNQAGMITVGVVVPGYAITPNYLAVAVFVDTTVYIDFISVEADGEAGIATTTALTLTFDEGMTTLTADDITLTGPALKGTMSAAGSGVYTLEVVVSAEGTVGVAVAKSGYGFTPPSLDVTVHFDSRVFVVDFDGSVTDVEPAYFTKLLGGATAFVNFVVNDPSYYIMGCEGTVSNTALIYNTSLPGVFSSYDVQIDVSGGATSGLSVGYITSLTDLSTYVQVATVPYVPGGSGSYIVSLAAATGVPEGAYFAVRYIPSATWFNNSISLLKVYER